MTIYKWFGSVDDELVAGDQWLDAEIMTRLYGFGNALFEGVLDRFAPGGSQSIKGHDHATQGGRAVARGTAYTAGTGGAGSIYGGSDLFTATIASAAAWYDVDADSNIERVSAGIPMWKVYVSEGMNTATKGSYLWAYFHGAWTGHPYSSIQTSIRIVNSTTATNSETYTQTDSPTGGSPIVDVVGQLVQIPCEPGWNDLKMQVQFNTVHSSFDFNLINISILEAPASGGAVATSSGSQKL